jgi:hypothetical protein
MSKNDNETILDVTLNHLVNPTGQDSPLRSLIKEIDAQWVGADRERAATVRVGSVYISNGPDGRHGEITLKLRFPLDLTKVKP